MSKKSEEKKQPIAVMTVKFYEGYETEVTFRSWVKINPGRIERSSMHQIRAWEAKRAEEIQRVNREGFQQSLTGTPQPEEQVDG